MKLMECKLLESRFLSSVQAPSRAPTCGVVVDCLCNMTLWVVFIPASRHLTNDTVFHVPAIFQFDNQCAINTVISQIGTASCAQQEGVICTQVYTRAARTVSAEVVVPSCEVRDSGASLCLETMQVPLVFALVPQTSFAGKVSCGVETANVELVFSCLTSVSSSTDVRCGIAVVVPSGRRQFGTSWWRVLSFSLSPLYRSCSWAPRGNALWTTRRDSSRTSRSRRSLSPL